MITTLINGIASDHVSVKDRAFNYGDGVFETLAINNSKIHFWAAHFARLQKGCETLGIEPPTESALLNDIKKLQFSDAPAVLKIVVSRGVGGRGYLADQQIQPTTVITVNPWPEDIEKKQQQGIAIRLCKHKLIINPALAGIKHLNRIDQVMARNEWHNDDIQEGLMLDVNDHIVEGTASNIFCFIGDSWVTPPATSCAVAGVVRAQLINKLADTGQQIIERKIQLSELSSVKEMIVCNSVWGILPVVSCEELQFTIGQYSRDLQQILEQETEVTLHDI